MEVPTIGIGAGRYCDGQILVVHDTLGMYSDFTPKFVKQYAQLRETITEAVGTYISEVKNQQFPEKKHTFTMDDSVLERLY
ncbi:3-methyl-2-oxobutanoate hydroxymethyltransferase [bioreactor metagenome]|uniref:3-methyl-2-oxobutanoate hydroxymethyltransferase n=1 Tax=bioreactor metagenome TaxID=1076179 RepID=A0A644X3Q0_9ZZZZ